MNNMVDKYNLFFRSIKEFVLGLDLVVEKDESKKKIIVSDKIFKKENFCDAINSFLSIFETQVEFKNNGLGNAFFNYSSILKAQERASKKNVALDILNVKLIDGWEERVADFGKSELQFLKYDCVGSSYMFIDNDIENPIIYIYWEGGEVTSNDLVFTSYVRGMVFWEIIRGLNQLPSNEKLDNINWLRFYAWFYQNHKKTSNKLVSWRYEFNNFIQENQIENKDLLGVDEFEIEFIKYLFENKGLEHTKNVFNPYSSIVTYREYLNE